MQQDYFRRVTQETPTRLWINNPTPETASQAIAAGAISCTTNPTYSAHMIGAESQSARALKIVEEVSQQMPDDDSAASEIQLRLVKPILERFLRLHEEQPGLQGFVSIQGNPRLDYDSDRTVSDALQFRKLGSNFIAKVPVTAAGLRAMETLIAEGVPIIATEVFALAQVLETCEMYNRVTTKTGTKPPLYVTHITGIFDEYLAAVAARERIAVAPDLLRSAGCTLARKQHRLMMDRRYLVSMMGGGARGTHHFTEMVGGSIHVTINWSTAEELLRTNPPVISRIDQEPEAGLVEELCLKLPDFKKAWSEDGLAAEEFEQFGPLQYFRDMFVKGWDVLLEAIQRQRKAAIANRATGHGN